MIEATDWRQNDSYIKLAVTVAALVKIAMIRTYKHSTGRLQAYLVFIALLISSCSNSKKDTLFERMDNESIGVDFQNTVKNREDFNIFNYRNFYNGGG